MTNKEKYKAYCSSEFGIPIFSQYWWLELVSGSANWDVAILEEGNIVATLPYSYNRIVGFNGIGMPLLTPFLGPYIVFPKDQKKSKRISFENRVLEQLVSSLPLKSFFRQSFHYSYSNWLSLYWKNYKQTTRYTYVIEDLSDLEVVFSNFSSNIRGKIRKAKKTIEVRSDLNPKILYQLVDKTFRRRKLKTPYTFELVQKILIECDKRSCGRMFYGIDEFNNIHAAIFVVWDHNSAYYILGGGDEKYTNSGAKSLLLWEAIKESQQHVKKFDFEGSMMKSVEIFFRSFGGTQKEYLYISKSNSKMFFILEKMLEFKKSFF